MHFVFYGQGLPPQLRWRPSGSRSGDWRNVVAGNADGDKYTPVALGVRVANALKEVMVILLVISFEIVASDGGQCLQYLIPTAAM